MTSSVVKDLLQQSGSDGFFALNEIAHREVANERLVMSKVPVADAMRELPHVTDEGINRLLSILGHEPATPFGEIPWRERVSLYRAVRAESRVNALDAFVAANGRDPLAQGHDAGWSGYRNEGQPEFVQIQQAMQRGDLDEHIKAIHAGMKKQGIDPEEMMAMGIGPMGVTDYASATSYTSPAFTPIRTITCTTLAQWNTAWAGIATGDRINVEGVTFTGEFTLSGKNLSGAAEVHFDNNPAAVCTFNGFTSGSITTLPSIWVTNCSNIRFFGGNIHNLNGNYGIEMYTCHNVWWWNALLTQCGGSPVFVTPTSSQGAGDGYDMKLESTNNMQNYLTVDPHPAGTKGGGVHTYLIADGTGDLNSGRFACYGHDEICGDWCQIGQPGSPQCIGITLIGKAVNYTFRITADPHGYGILTWGSGKVQWTCPYLEATNMASRAVGQPSVTYSGGMTLCSLTYGRATNTNIYAADLAAHDSGISSTEPWDPRKGMTYGDIGTGGGGGGIPPSNTVAPALVGAPVVGSPMTVALGTWAGSPTSYTYQWQRDNHNDGVYTNIGGATLSSFTPAVASDGCNVRCLVTAQNAAGSSAAVPTNTKLITMPAPVNTTPPTLSGTPSVGAVLSVAQGVWTNMNGYNPTYTYQWQSLDPATGVWSPISGATGLTYTVQAGDGNKQIKVTETAHNTGTN